MNLKYYLTNIPHEYDVKAFRNTTALGGYINLVKDKIQAKKAKEKYLHDLEIDKTRMLEKETFDEVNLFTFDDFPSQDYSCTPDGILKVYEAIGKELNKNNKEE